MNPYMVQKTNGALKQNSGSAEAPPPVLAETQDHFMLHLS
jgi:hypothetical protein